MQIFNRLSNPATGEDGWAFMPFLMKRVRNATFWQNTPMFKRDFLFNALCDFSQKDCFSFFDAWGIPVSTGMRSLMLNTYPALDKMVWTYNPVTNQGGTGTVTGRKFHDRINWSVVASSEELVGEVSSNSGPAVKMLDGDLNTYWHTKYQPSASPPPYTITVDMAQINTVTGFYLTSRIGSRRPNGVTIAVSNDGVTYTTLTTIQAQNKDNRQYFPLSSARSFRYFRLTITTTYDTNNAALSEIGTY